MTFIWDISKTQDSYQLTSDLESLLQIMLPIIILAAIAKALSSEQSFNTIAP